MQPAMVVEQIALPGPEADTALTVGDGAPQAG